VGTILPSKGCHHLLHAFVLLGRPELELHFHGEQTPYHENRSYIHDLRASVPDGFSVHFHGRYEASELPGILANIDLLVVPSLWWESYCLTAREGALAGLPVIVFPVGGLADAVARGVAVAANPADPESLCRLVREMIDDEELRRRASAQGHLVRDSRDCAAQVEGIYLQLATRFMSDPVSP
jgi:glycosyltransferase involved in cell wall biosynthesis